MAGAHKCRDNLEKQAHEFRGVRLAADNQEGPLHVIAPESPNRTPNTVVDGQVSEGNWRALSGLRLPEQEYRALICVTREVVAGRALQGRASESAISRPSVRSRTKSRE